MEQRFIEEADQYLGEYLRKIEHCTSLLTEAQVWWKPNEACNSVGNLLLHLRGNLSQWVLGGIGGEPIARHRSAEFAASETAAKSEMLAGLADSSVNASARRYVRPLPFHAGPTLQIRVYVRRSVSITFITQSEKVFRDRWRQCWFRFNLSDNVPEIMPLSSVLLDINNI